MKKKAELLHASHPSILNRLKRAKGHLQKVIEMLENGDSCLNITQQLYGVCNALHNAKVGLVKDHIDHCIGEGLVDDDRKTQRSKIHEFKEIAKYL